MDYASYYNSYYGNSAALDAGVGAALGAMLGMYLVIILVIYVLQIIAMWRIFSKAGEAGWKSLIPIYNAIILFKVSGLSPWLILAYLAAIIPFVGWIVPIVITILQANGLSKSFGKSTGFTVGLVLLPSIFYLILGFGNSEYIGSSTNTTVTEE